MTLHFSLSYGGPVFVWQGIFSLITFVQFGQMTKKAQRMSPSELSQTLKKSNNNKTNI
jgi:hypothetical protein